MKKILFLLLLGTFTKVEAQKSISLESGMIWSSATPGSSHPIYTTKKSYPGIGAYSTANFSIPLQKNKIHWLAVPISLSYFDLTEKTHLSGYIPMDNCIPADIPYGYPQETFLSHRIMTLGLAFGIQHNFQFKRFLMTTQVTHVMNAVLKSQLNTRTQYEMATIERQATDDFVSYYGVVNFGWDFLYKANEKFHLGPSLSATFFELQSIGGTIPNFRQVQMEGRWFTFGAKCRYTLK